MLSMRTQFCMCFRSARLLLLHWACAFGPFFMLLRFAREKYIYTKSTLLMETLVFCVCRALMCGCMGGPRSASDIANVLLGERGYRECMRKIKCIVIIIILTPLSRAHNRKVEILLYVYHCRRALYVHAWREARQHLLGSRFTAEPIIQITSQINTTVFILRC